MIDTFFILNSPIYISNQHPILYNLLIYVPFVLFNKITNNINLSYFLLSIVQLITIDVIITDNVSATGSAIKIALTLFSKNRGSI